MTFGADSLSVSRSAPIFLSEAGLSTRGPMDENAKGSCTRPHKTPPDFATQTLIREVGQAIEIDLIWPTKGLLRGSLGGGQLAPGRRQADPIQAPCDLSFYCPTG
jgi:hypothetical protein